MKAFLFSQLFAWIIIKSKKNHSSSSAMKKSSSYISKNLEAPSGIVLYNTKRACGKVPELIPTQATVTAQHAEVLLFVQK